MVAVRRRIERAAAVAAVVGAFALINLGIYTFLSGRLSNNFSDTSSIRMVDVASYLPFSGSESLSRVDADLTLEGDLPVLDGAAALVPVYASVIENIYPEGCVSYEGGSFSDDNYYGENFAEGSAMRYRNTIRGFKALVDGEADIFFTAAPSEEQMQYAREKGVELVSVPIGREAFVFFVNAKNPVNGLTTAQIRDIYAGNIRNWSEVGGPDRLIHPVDRIEGSGSRSAMDRFMGGTRYGRKSPLAFSGACIGYSFRYYLSGMVGNSGIKLLSVNGAYPDAESVRSGEYPLVTEFYAVYRKDGETENVKKVTDWLLSEQGQRMIEMTGYLPVK